MLEGRDAISFSLTKNNLKMGGGALLGGGRGSTLSSSDVRIMTVLPSGIAFQLADLALLDWAGYTNLDENIQKGRGGGLEMWKGCVCVQVCKKEKAQIYPTL